MVEYFYDNIKVSVNEESVICAFIEETDGTAITTNCDFTLYDEEGNIIYTVNGEYIGEMGYWGFAVPAITEPGKYFYTVGNNGVDLNFKTPYYVV